MDMFSGAGNAYNDIVKVKYSSKEMRELFSERNVVMNWRKCWIALAESEMQLGVKIINKEMIEEMKQNIDNIDFEAVRKKEEETQHDVVANIYAYGLVCPKSKDIIHLGATSQFVKCNTDLMIMREALYMLRSKLLTLLRNFDIIIEKFKTVPVLGYVHYEPAQPLTMGRRLCNYAQDFISDYDTIVSTIDNLTARGVKGAIGTQDSFMLLFDGDTKKIEKLDLMIAKKLGFEKLYKITTQTYTRKQDIMIMQGLANIAATAKRLATDIRLMSNLNIVEEPFTEGQVGSSATPFKRTPLRSERLCSLARKVINNLPDFYHTYSEQWLERSLDDSAIRRIDIPTNFMLVEYIIDLMNEITSGLVVYPTMAAKALRQELPFMATERIIMATLKKGANRSEISNILREHQFNLAKHIKMEGGENNLIEMLASDSRIGLSREELIQILDIRNFVGRSLEQTDTFLKDQLRPILKKNKIK